jgi:hypothetical protein
MIVRAGRAFAYAFLTLGVVILVKTVALGGGQVGYLAAAVFLALGIIRLRALRP